MVLLRGHFYLLLIFFRLGGITKLFHTKYFSPIKTKTRSNNSPDEFVRTHYIIDYPKCRLSIKYYNGKCGRVLIALTILNVIVYLSLNQSHIFSHAEWMLIKFYKCLSFSNRANHVKFVYSYLTCFLYVIITVQIVDRFSI